MWSTVRAGVLRAGLMLPLVLGLSACGGGSSGGESGSFGTNAESTGQVGVLITDAPSDQFEEILVTIDEVLLLSADEGAEPVSLFQGSKTIDLLQLRGVADLITVDDSVPTGDYEKVRLRISGLELVDRDASGAVVERINPPLPANGKIDLNPRQTFQVQAEQTLLLELDLDAEKSIHIVSTGNNNRYRFRPVVFVNLKQPSGGAPAGKLSRIFGEVESLGDDGASLRLCSTHAASETDDSVVNEESDCTTVRVDERTGVFSSTGEGTSLDVVTVGDQLTAVGFFEEETDTEAEDDLHLAAVVLELGPSGTFIRTDGRIDSVVNGSDQFEFATDASERFAEDTLLTVQLQSGSRIFARSGEELDRTAIQVGAEAQVDGVETGGEPEVRAALVVIDTTATGDDTLSGTLQSVDTSAGTLTVTGENGDVCVATDSDTEVVILRDSADGTTTEEASLADLESGWTVEVQGEQSVSGCFGADAVIAEPES